MILQTRDIETLQYLAEMKVAGTEHIQNARFQKRIDGEEWKSQRAIQKRLQILSSEGLIDGRRFPFRQQFYYTLAPKGLKILLGSGLVSNRKLKRLRLNELQHDLTLSGLRIHLEKSGIATEWVSEVLIRERFNFFKSVRLIPDALYRNAEGQWVALEFERARKDKRRYDEKLQNLVRLIRSRYKEEITFHKVHVVCEFEYVQKQIEDIAYIYQPLVHVELRSKLEGNQRTNYEK